MNYYVAVPQTTKQAESKHIIMRVVTLAKKMASLTNFLIVGALVFTATISATSATARDASQSGEKPSTKKQLPRFVSLKADRVNVRLGPTPEHGVKWIYRRLGLPVEIIKEFEHWRQIRDSEGAEGWVFYRLLSERRTAMILAPKGDGADAGSTKNEKTPIPIFANRSKSADVAVQVESGVIVNVLKCDRTWCLVSLNNYRGWIEQVRLWGVYPGESLD